VVVADVLEGIRYALDEIFLLDDGHFTLCDEAAGSAGERLF
jgi:hypothetical protein